MKDIREFLSKNEIQYRDDIRLCDISTFKIGGKAGLVCYPDSAIKTSLTVKFCNLCGISYMAFGKCSNVLFPDDGLETLVIKTDLMDNLEFADGVFSFGSGAMLAKASKFTVDSSYKGMEFAYGIPGSVGGAVFMNAGAYGGEMSQCVIRTEYVDEDANICVLEKNAHDFSNRHSYFSNRRCIITKTHVELEKGNTSESESIITELQNRRKSKQPLDMPSAGSVFKRPTGYFAGQLIEECGLKGACVGGAQISLKHAGFIVNTGGATASDVKALISLIQDTVLEKFGVSLECELRIIEG